MIRSAEPSSPTITMFVSQRPMASKDEVCALKSVYWVRLQGNLFRPAFGKLLIDLDDPGRGREGKRLQDERVNDREDRRVCADAEREREQRHRREPASPSKAGGPHTSRRRPRPRKPGPTTTRGSGPAHSLRIARRAWSWLGGGPLAMTARIRVRIVPWRPTPLQRETLPRYEPEAKASSRRSKRCKNGKFRPGRLAIH